MNLSKLSKIVKLLFALLENYDRPPDRPTDPSNRQTDMRVHKTVTLPKTLTILIYESLKCEYQLKVITREQVNHRDAPASKNATRRDAETNGDICHDDWPSSALKSWYRQMMTDGARMVFLCSNQRNYTIYTYTYI